MSYVHFRGKLQSHAKINFECFILTVWLYNWERNGQIFKLLQVVY